MNSRRFSHTNTIFDGQIVGHQNPDLSGRLHLKLQRSTSIRQMGGTRNVNRQAVKATGKSDEINKVVSIKSERGNLEGLAAGTKNG